MWSRAHHMGCLHDPHQEHPPAPISGNRTCGVAEHRVLVRPRRMHGRCQNRVCNASPGQEVPSRLHDPDAPCSVGGLDLLSMQPWHGQHDHFAGSSSPSMFG